MMAVSAGSARGSLTVMTASSCDSMSLMEKGNFLSEYGFQSVTRRPWRSKSASTRTMFVSSS